MPTAVGTVMLLCLLPVGTMVAGSIVVTFFQPGPKLTSAMQHFAAGIVLAAVAIELAPQLAIRIHGQNGVFTIAMLLGFFFAIGVLMLISRYFDADDDEDEGKKDDEVVKKKEPEIFTSNPAIAVSTPTSAINLDIGSNKTTSTAYSSPVASPRSPMGGPSSLDVNSVNVSMPGATPGETDGRWNNNQPGYGNNNNNNNWNHNNNNNNNGRNRDESFPSQVDHIQYGARGTMDSGYGRGTMDAGYGGRGTMDAGYGGAGYGRQSTIGEGSDVSASSYSNNSQAPLTRAPNSSMSNMARGNMAGAPPRYGGNQGGYGNNGGYNNNGNNYGRAPYPPPPGPPSMPEPEGDWNGNNNNGGYGNNNNNWNNNMYNNQRGENMYNNQNWNTRTRQRGQSQHTWQPRVRYAAQWKNQGRSDMGYVPPPPPRRNQYGGGNNQWGNSVNRNQWNNGQQNWNNTNRTMDQTHARMPSYMLHGSASTGLAKSIARNSFKATSPPTISTGPTSFINTDLAKKATVAAPVGAFNIPWGLIVAVAVDASTDGILIGIASAVGQGGIIIAIALSIEMSFLGISTSVEMNEMGVPKNIQIPLLMVLPGFILVGGAIGSTVMAGVTGPLFVAFLGFGTAALLFLVVEELLISAHEDLAHDTWYVSISLFVGFMIVLIMDQFSGPNMCIDSINLAFAALNLDENGKQLPGKAVLTMGPG